MIGMAFLAAAAAAQAPVMLASRDELQWRMFVRASVRGRQTPPSSRTESRLMRLKNVVGGLGDVRDDEAQRLPGPSGL